MTGLMTPDAEVQAAIGTLMAEFCWRVDRGGGGVADLFTPDARLIISGGGALDEQTEGRDALAARWAGRPSDHVTRHAFTNLLISRTAPNLVMATSLGLGFRHIGPGVGSTAPLVVADYDDRITRCSDGRWRFDERRVNVVFADPSFRS